MSKEQDLQAVQGFPHWCMDCLVAVASHRDTTNGMLHCLYVFKYNPDTNIYNPPQTTALNRVDAGYTYEIEAG